MMIECIQIRKRRVILTVLELQPSETRFNFSASIDGDLASPLGSGTVHILLLSIKSSH